MLCFGYTKTNTDIIFPISYTINFGVGINHIGTNANVVITVYARNLTYMHCSNNANLMYVDMLYVTIGC